MKKRLIILFLSLFSVVAHASDQHTQQLKAMFHNMVEQKNIALMPTYYDINFELFSNGNKMSDNQFLSMHEEVYKTDIQYHSV